MKDGYLEFFQRFNITDDDFLDFANSSILLIPKDKAHVEWQALKSKISQTDECVYVRFMPVMVQGIICIRSFIHIFLIVM